MSRRTLCVRRFALSEKRLQTTGLPTTDSVTLNTKHFSGHSVLSIRKSVLRALCALRHAPSDLASAVSQSSSALFCVHLRLIYPFQASILDLPSSIIDSIFSCLSACCQLLAAICLQSILGLLLLAAYCLLLTVSCGPVVRGLLSLCAPLFADV